MKVDCAPVRGYRHYLRTQLEYLALTNSSRRAGHSRSAKNEQNVCVDGRLLPELFVLGMPKTGTTTLSTILRNTGVKSNMEPYKETKFFNDFMWENRSLTQPLPEMARTNYIYLNPLCPSARRVVAEYTPSYLMMTPLPREYWNNFSTALSWNVAFDYYYSFPGEADLPMVLKNLYGPALGGRLKFVVTMREPLAQLQSAFYFMCCLQRMNFQGRELLEISPARFAQELGRFVNSSLEVPEVAPLLYARHLAAYLRHFTPSQFYMIPFRFLFHQNVTVRKEVVGGIFRLLGISPQGPIEFFSEPLMTSPHPRLQDSVPRQLASDFQRLLLPQNAALVRLLAEMSLKGSRLAGYDGAPGSEPNISTWLKSHW